jgi:hypothetical protein
MSMPGLPPAVLKELTFGVTTPIVLAAFICAFLV